MKRINSLLSAGVTLTSSGTAVAAPIPLDSAGYFPRFVRVVATGAGCFVKVGDIGVTAVSGDCMIQPLDGTVLNVRGCKAISAISVSGTSSVTVVPLEAGSWNYDQRTLDYNFTTLSAVPSTVTFTRGSSGTFFGSDGLMKVQGYNELLWSNDFTQTTPWVAITGTRATVTTGIADPFGGTSASRLTFAANSDVFGQIVTKAIAVNDVYTNSIWVRSASASGLRLRIARAGAGVYEDASYSIPVSSTWTRISVSKTFANVQTGVRLDVENNSGVVGATIEVYGAQLEKSSTATQYSPTTATANSAPRLDYDPVTLLPRGLLVEEQRTNLLLNSDVAGTNLATQSITVTAAPWTVSFTGTGTITFSGAYVGSLVGTGASTRVTSTFTPSAGSLTCTVTGTVKWAQAELGSFATSFIPTAGASAPRSADSASMTGTNLTSWMNQTAGTLVVEYEGTPSTSGPLFNSSAAGGLNMTDNDGGNNFRVSLATVAYVDTTGTATTAGTVYKSAFSYQAGDYRSCTNGGAVQTSTNATAPVSQTTYYIGRNSAGTGYLNNHIRRLTAYATTLPSATLQSLTS